MQRSPFSTVLELPLVRYAGADLATTLPVLHEGVCVPALPPLGVLDLSCKGITTDPPASTSTPARPSSPTESTSPSPLSSSPSSSSCASLSCAGPEFVSLAEFVELHQRSSLSYYLESPPFAQFLTHCRDNEGV